MKRKLLLLGLLAALLITAGLVFARDYTTLKKLVITVDDVPPTSELANIQNLNISANGRYLIYEAEGYDTQSGLFLYDLQTDQRKYIGAGELGWVSDDGRYVFVTSDGHGPNYWNTATLHDLSENQSLSVGIGLNGEPLNGRVDAAAMSPDGRYLVYYTNAANPFDKDLFCPNPDTPCLTVFNVFLWDRQTNTHKRISVNSQEETANNDSGFASISDDGRYILFASDATNLSPTPLPCIYDHGCSHLYVRDRISGTTELVNIDAQGNLVFEALVYTTVFHFDISGNGQYVVFNGNNNPDVDNLDLNLFVRDIINDTTEMVNVDSNGVRIPKARNAGYNIISHDGRFVMFIGGDGLLYVRDRFAGITTIASKDSDGNTGTLLPSTYERLSPAAMSANGDVVVFSSNSDTLVGATPGDTSEKLFVSQGGLIPPTSTPQPSSTPSCAGSTELLLNGGFEIAESTANSAANWQEKRLLRSKRVQNKLDKTVAHTGDFAFQFKGSGKITQTVNSVNDCGTVLTLSAWVEGRKLNTARVQAKVIYTDGDPVKLRLVASELNGTYSYKPLSATLNLSGDVESIKVQISKRNSIGRLRIDDVSLTLGADVLALPQ